jgi:hypothetical protein
MDHQRIEEGNVAELYAAGQLSAEEEALFEEHLIECRECRERVAWAEDLKGSFQAMASEDRARAAVGIGLVAWLARHERAARLGLAALLLLALVLPAWLLAEQGRLRRELALARAEAARSHPPAQPEAPSRPDPLEEERRRLESQLQAQLQETEALKKQLSEITRPQVNTALFSLGVIRGEGDRTNRVVIGPRPEWIVLAIEAPETGPDSWRATLLDRAGRTVWHGEGLRPTANDELVLSLYSDLLKPGDYRLRLDGTPPQGRVVRSEIPFRVEGRR